MLGTRVFLASLALTSHVATVLLSVDSTSRAVNSLGGEDSQNVRPGTGVVMGGVAVGTLLLMGLILLAVLSYKKAKACITAQKEELLLNNQEDKHDKHAKALTLKDFKASQSNSHEEKLSWCDRFLGNDLNMALSISGVGTTAWFVTTSAIKMADNIAFLSNPVAGIALSSAALAAPPLYVFANRCCNRRAREQQRQIAQEISVAEKAFKEQLKNYQEGAFEFSFSAGDYWARGAIFTYFCKNISTANAEMNGTDKVSFRVLPKELKKVRAFFYPHLPQIADAVVLDEKGEPATVPTSASATAVPPPQHTH